MLLITIGLLGCSGGDPVPCPVLPSCPAPSIETSRTFVSVERREAPLVVPAIEAVLTNSVRNQDPDPRVDVQVLESSIVAVMMWNPGEGYAGCTLVYDRAGLSSRACNGIYVSHSMGDGNQRYEYSVQERYLGERIAVSGSLRATLLTTGVVEDTVLTLDNAVEVIDGYFNTAPRLDPALVVDLDD